MSRHDRILLTAYASLVAIFVAAWLVCLALDATR